jgi:hypothetical protein
MEAILQNSLFKRLGLARRRAPAAADAGCFVIGCQTPPVILVAADHHGRALMCVAHARAWTASPACQRARRHGAAPSLVALGLGT